MRSEDATQFSIEIDVKNDLDMYKANHKEIILEKYARKKRMITNSLAIRFLLDVAKENEELMKKEPWRKRSKKR
jgi:hypothetical protein